LYFVVFKEIQECYMKDCVYLFTHLIYMLQTCYGMKPREMATPPPRLSLRMLRPTVESEWTECFFLWVSTLVSLCLVSEASVLTVYTCPLLHCHAKVVATMHINCRGCCRSASGHRLRPTQWPGLGLAPRRAHGSGDEEGPIRTAWLTPQVEQRNSLERTRNRPSQYLHRKFIRNLS
jgi:hypothetical protein